MSFKHHRETSRFLELMHSAQRERLRPKCHEMWYAEFQREEHEYTMVWG